MRSRRAPGRRRIPSSSPATARMRSAPRTRRARAPSRRSSSRDRPLLRPADVLEFVPGRDRHPAQRRRQGQPVLPARLQPRPRHRLRHLRRRHAGQHADARAWPGLHRPQLPDPRTGRPHPATARARTTPRTAISPSAGSARIAYVDRGSRRHSPRSTVGENGYQRAARSPARRRPGPARCSTRSSAATTTVPGTCPEKFPQGQWGAALSASAGADDHSASRRWATARSWNSTDQIPQRAVDGGLLGRFGALDPTDGGQTARYSLSLRLDARRSATAHSR